MKTRWEIKKLVEVGKIFSGNSINERVKKEKYENIKEGLPYIATKDISYDYKIDYNNGIKIPKEELKNFKISHKNSIFICAEGGSAGRKMAFNAKDVCFVNKLFTLESFDFVEPRFVYYFYQTEDFQRQFKSMITGLIGGVSMNKFKEIKIPLPPISEQKYIVEILDKSFEKLSKTKENAEDNIQNAKEIFNSYLRNVFENKGEGWEEKTLEQVSNIFGRGKSKHRPRNDKILYDGNYPFIQTGDIRNCDHYITKYTQTYNEIGLKQSKLWPKGTICITIAANIAETGILSFDACFPDSIIGIVVNDKIADSDFMEYLLQFFKVKLQALGKGSAQANINMATFEGEVFPIPPLKQQQSIVKKLNSLSSETKKLEEIYQQKLNDLEELKKAILQKAFNGELTKN